ncbi:MAG: hypothetical protein HN742_26830 [Lentisphaerae bacterium]|jgi:hypothetical protein|nr:hypothetical protein [Lentisphaerota bacterium]MBT7914823.1 hypothetical protein [Candidatus Bathyarchaeota archaeon]MBT4823024.1 hypothetical protein [Lentisphaerota bacterium]MBT5611390.1 hypothetical protein [Lentisphaerota bacterium]MBT7057045.1 hypothetical protein [Lentisphaerota bacterium]
MFLHELNEDEHRAFLELAYNAVKSSGKILDEELDVFRSYAYECEIPDYEPTGEDVDAVVEKLKASTPQVKKVILTELMGIWAADNRWDDGEMDMMYHVGQSFGVPDTMTNRLRRWAKELRELVAEGYELIER